MSEEGTIRRQKGSSPLPPKEQKILVEEGQLSVDVYHTDKELIIIAPVAGTKIADINVDLTDEVLTIKGTRELNIKNLDPDQFLTKECFWGTFSRSIVLPPHIDTGKIKAKFNKSILYITIPKTEPIRTKAIPIKSS